MTIKKIKVRYDAQRRNEADVFVHSDMETAVATVRIGTGWDVLRVWGPDSFTRFFGTDEGKEFVWVVCQPAARLREIINGTAEYTVPLSDPACEDIIKYAASL